MFLSALLKKLMKVVLQPYFRLTRSQTLGVRAVVLNEQNQILLVRHTYVPGWMFPGGGVERSETFEAAVIKELDEEVGVQVRGAPSLLGVYANFESFAGDHVAVYVVRDYSIVARQSLEIAEFDFFDLDALPEATSPGTRRRLDEVFSGAKPSQHW